jgi:hypothetical protein
MTTTEREWTPAGVSAAVAAIAEVSRDGAHDDKAIGDLLDAMERDGECEVSPLRSKSKRPEIITARDEWFA